MAEESIFGLPIEAPSEETEVTEEITAEAVTEEDASEGSPVEEGQPRDEYGRFTSQTAPEEDPEPETPEDVLESGQEAPEAVVSENPDEPVEEEQPYLWANKFETPEALEKGYGESIRMWQRANDARKVEAQEKLQLQEQYAALYRQMQEAVPILQQAAERERAHQAFAEKYRSQYGEYPEGYTPPAPPSAPGPQDVQAIVDQRLAQERAAWEAQMAQRQQEEALVGAVQSLYATNPDLDPGDDQQSQLIYDALTELNIAWDRYGIEVDPADQGSLQIAYEASKDAALLEVLKLNPAYFESEYGMELARRDAAVISGRVPATTAPQTTRVPASQVKARGGKKPFTEAANVGANAPAAEDQSDPWVRVKNAPLEGGPTTPGQRKSVFFE